MSNGSGAGTAAGGILFIAGAYWFAVGAIAVAAVTVLGVVIAIAIAAYATWGIGLYAMAVSRSIRSDNLVGFSPLVIAPLMTPLSILGAFIVTGLLGFPSAIEWFQKWSVGTEENSISVSAQLFGLLGGIVFVFVILPFLFLGWLYAGMKGYKAATRNYVVDESSVYTMWLLWGAVIGLTMDPGLWQQLFQELF